MNNVNLVGRLTKDPELRYLQGSGQAACQFTLAVDKNLSKDKKQQFESRGKPTADFIRIVVWGSQAQHCANYLAKGRRAAVTGSINTSTYTKQNGEKGYSVDVMAQRVEFLDFGEKKQEKQQGDWEDDFLAVDDDDDIPF